MPIVFAAVFAVISFTFQIFVFIFNHNKEIQHQYWQLVHLQPPLSAYDKERIIDFIDTIRLAQSIYVLRRAGLWQERVQRLEHMLDITPGENLLH